MTGAKATAQAIEVRECADAGQLSALHATCFDDGWSEASLTELMSTPGVHGFAACDGEGRPLGFLVLRQAADEAEIISIGVQPDSRREGIGSALLDASIETCRAHAAASLFLEVAADNTAAQRFYAGAGFSVAGTRKGYYTRPGRAAVDAIVMVLRLG